MDQYFKGIIWPRGPAPTPVGGKLYRYTVIGMVITDKPLPDLEGKNEVLLEGHAAGIAEAIDSIPQRDPAYRVGTADSILLNLKNL
jgi:hypothetical protein